jgi:hypothetical protein
MADTKGFARIHQQAKSAMQSGRAGKAGWVLSFVPSEAQRADQLVGWYGSADTAKQVTLHFDSRDQAIAYAEAQGLRYEAEAPAKAAGPQAGQRPGHKLSSLIWHPTGWLVTSSPRNR